MALIRRWKLDELVGGVLVDSGGSGFDATPIDGDPSFVAPPEGTNLKAAAYFDGARYAATAVNGGDLGNVFTWMAWMKLTSTAGRYSPFSAGELPWMELTNYFGFAPQPAMAKSGDFNAYTVSNPPYLVVDEWFHLAIARSGVGAGLAKFFVTRGVSPWPSATFDHPYVTGTNAADFSATGKVAYIGSRGAGTQLFPGAIADMRVYSTALSQADVESILASYKSANPVLMGSE